MSGGQPRSGRRLSGALLHVTAAVLVPLCLAAGVFEFTRARSGHDLAWGYTVEWPLIAGYGVYLWVRLARERAGDTHPAPPASAALPAAPAPAPTPPGPPAADTDPELAAWQAYLADLHAADPPGGPPPRVRREPGRSTMPR